MSGRPCNPGSDFKGLWQVFLRDMPMPQCQLPSDLRPSEGRNAANADAAPSAHDPADPAADTSNR